MQKPIKVRVVIEVEVDRDAYDAEYGTRESVADIRAHIDGSIREAAQMAFAHVDHAVTVR